MEFGYRRYFRILFVSQIELRYLRTLVAPLETGSLVEASERVFLTQWALSHQVKDRSLPAVCTVLATRVCRLCELSLFLARWAVDLSVLQQAYCALWKCLGRSLHRPLQD